MKIRIVYVLCLILWPATAISQMPREVKDTLFNQVDEQGLKQGYWKKKHPNGNIRYTGQFVNDRPVGTFKRYYEDQTLQSIMDYQTDGNAAFTTFFYQNGEIAAEGKYLGKEKDSIWNYYSYYGGHLSYRERYHNGLKDGPSRKFYEDGSPSEELFWKNGKKHGSWKIWYPSGTLKMETTFSEDKIHGAFISYTPDGQREIEGRYHYNLKTGTWKFHDPDSGLIQEIKYIDGLAENQDEIDKKFTERMDAFEKQKDRIAEPDINSFLNEIRK